MENWFNKGKTIKIVITALISIGLLFPCQALGAAASYDLREQGRTTTVKNQGRYGICWAFSTLASFESNLISKKATGKGVDLSEAHLAFVFKDGSNNYSKSRYAGKDRFSVKKNDDGSNHWDTVALLARGYGAVTDKTMPMSKVNSSKYRTQSMKIKHPYLLTNADFIYPNTKKTSLDKTRMNQIKTYIAQKGAMAVIISMGSDEGEKGFASDMKKRFGTATLNKMTSYYYTGSTADHSVTVIGWDDNYSKNNFKSGKPAGNGAWLIKNSWGTNVHDGGYFWASYYSPSMSEFVGLRGEKNTGRAIYQYDGVGIGDEGFAFPYTISGANVYKARQDMLIDRVGVWTPEAGMKTNVKIYVNKQTAAPTSGRLVYNKTFTVKSEGFHTLYTKKNVGIPKGSKFSVIIKNRSTKGSGYHLPFETRIANYAHVVPEKKIKGQSYVKLGKAKWRDTKSYGYRKLGPDTYTIYNALIKAYSKPSGKVKQKIVGKASYRIKKGRKAKIRVARTRGNGILVFRSTKPTIVSVSKTGVIKAKRRGKAKIVVDALPTAKCKSAKKTIVIRVR